MRLNLRINIDSDNVDEYSVIENYFEENFGEDNRISFAPAFIVNTTKNDNASAITAFEEKMSFFGNIAKQKGTKTHLYPNDRIIECTIRNNNSWTIDSNGDIYKCWEIVGNKECKVGELMEKGIKITDLTMLNRYLYGADFL